MHQQNNFESYCWFKYINYFVLAYDYTSDNFSFSQSFRSMRGKVQQQVKFGNALKQAMKSRQLSMRRLALEADLEYAHVQRIAAGKVNIEFSTLIALADGLKMTPSELLGYF